MNALDLLRARLAEVRKKSVLASELGVSRPAVSLLLAGKYKGGTARMEARIIARYGQGQVLCPHLRREIGVADCQRFRKRPQPTSDPQKLRHWTACRDCAIGKALERGLASAINGQAKETTS